MTESKYKQRVFGFCTDAMVDVHLIKRFHLSMVVSLLACNISQQ